MTQHGFDEIEVEKTWLVLHHNILAVFSMQNECRAGGRVISGWIHTWPTRQLITIQCILMTRWLAGCCGWGGGVCGRQRRYQ